MNREMCKVLNDELMAAAKVIAEKHGMTVKAKGGRFDATGFTPNLEFCVANAGEIEWANFHAMFGLPADGFNRRFFDRRGDAYVTCGLNPNAHAMPVLAKAERDGRVYKFRALDVKIALGVK